ncbi:hypothetical protein HDV00_005592 [Rhizophlyctis rosea]|nr:hypothetical protein HDV00_005592 [Rhizophlyctis rosea]
MVAPDEANEATSLELIPETSASSRESTPNSTDSPLGSDNDDVVLKSKSELFYVQRCSAFCKHHLHYDDPAISTEQFALYHLQLRKFVTRLIYAAQILASDWESPKIRRQHVEEAVAWIAPEYLTPESSDEDAAIIAEVEGVTRWWWEVLQPVKRKNGARYQVVVTQDIDQEDGSLPTAKRRKIYKSEEFILDSDEE